MHNKDIIFDVENSRIGIAESDCSKGTSTVEDPINVNVDTKIIKDYIIKRPLLINKDWFTSSKLETISSVKKDVSANSSTFLLPTIDKLKCYIVDKAKEIKLLDFIFIITGTILCIFIILFIIGSFFFRLKKNFLIFKYSNISQVSRVAPVTNNELELSQHNI